MSYKEFSLEDLYLQMQDDLYDGLKEEIPLEVNEALSRGQTPTEILEDGLVAGMDIVGVDFRDGILFVPEVLMAANAMKEGMSILRPLLVETGAPRVGTMVVGTVKGDLHDIGKSLVLMMAEGAGFTCVNLGTNTSAPEYIAAVKEHI
jgi:5-methyltetrahydrofolate--homocysteine methyltransferase